MELSEEGGDGKMWIGGDERREGGSGEEVRWQVGGVRLDGCDWRWVVAKSGGWTGRWGVIGGDMRTVSG